MPPTPDEFIQSADKFLASTEKALALNAKEVEGLRRNLIGDIRNIGSEGVAGLGTTQIGPRRVLVLDPPNLRAVGAVSTRTRDRFSNFRLQWLDKANMEELVAGPLANIDTGKFIKNSRRLADNAKEFLREIQELEPDLSEEIESTIQQIDDAQNDLLKLEVRSWTRMDENLRRTIGGRMTQARAGEVIKSFDVNRNIYNLSMLEHPKAVTRSLFAKASEKAAERVTRSVTELPKRAVVLVAAPPGAVAKMTPGTRVADFMWRTFTAAELDRRFAKKASEGLSVSTWRDLGEAHGTPEWYLPVPPEIVDDVEAAMKGRRKKFLAEIKK